MRRPLFAVLMALLSLALAPSPAAAADAPNTCLGATITSAQNAWLKESINPAADVDWYRFTTTASRTVVVTLGNLPADDRIDLYSTCSTLLASSNRSGQQFEEIVRLLPAGTYRVKVSGVAGASSANQYWLKFRAIAAGMTVLSAGPFVVGSKLHLVGEVLNTTTGNRRAVQVTARLYDSAGALLGTVTGPAYRTIVPAGGRTSFHLFRSVPSGYHHASFSVASSATSSIPLGKLTVTPGTKSLAGTILHYPGTVKNGNAFRIADTQVLVTAYNATGSVLNAGAVTSNPSTINAQQSAPFEFVTSRHTGTNRWAFVGQAKPNPIGPDRETCAGYPEPRTFVEAQSWWLQTPGGGGSDFGHMHVGACMPYHQTVSGVIGIDVRIVLHDNPGRFDYLNPVLVSNHQELSLAHDLTLHGLTCPIGTCTGWVHLDVDTRLLTNDGLEEIRLRAYVDEPDGNIMHSSINTLADFRNGNPVSDLDRRAYQRGKGWYTGSGYCESDVVSNLPVGPVSGVWRPALRIVDHGAADDLPVTHHSVRLDPDFHAVPPLPGRILVDGSGPWEGSVAIDTTTLSNGRHRLVLRADCDDPRGSTNSGVLVVAFTVSN